MKKNSLFRKEGSTMLFLPTAILALAAGPWDQLSITWPSFNSLPIIPVDASSGGWLQDASCSEGAKFNRFYKQVASSLGHGR
jgi:hypothetical protein